MLSESVASAKLLLLTNYRPEYRHEWGQKTYYTQLRLAPFGRAEAEEFLDVLFGGRPPVGATTAGCAPHDLKQLILEKTEGTPFFMEEIVQDLVEQGVLIRTEVGAVRRDRPYHRYVANPSHRPRRPRRPHRPSHAGGESPAATARRHWAGVPVSLSARSSRNRRRTLPVARVATAQRVSLRTTRVSRSGVHLQACADAGSGVQLRVD